MGNDYTDMKSGYTDTQSDYTDLGTSYTDSETWTKSYPKNSLVKGARKLGTP